MVTYYPEIDSLVYLNFPGASIGGASSWLVPIPEAWQAACEEPVDALFWLGMESE